MMNLPPQWRLPHTRIALEQQTLLMAVLNATPDSFSDGGIWADAQRAVERGFELLDQGADILDIGGESTRPGASPVDPAVEQSRVIPVIRGILRQRPDALISVDTYHAGTARLALETGARIVNDVSGGLWDEEMRGVCAAGGCGVVLMHTRGKPQEWRSLPPLDRHEVVDLVVRELRERVEEAIAAGVCRDAIAVDPGFGFGKMLDENFVLLAGLEQVRMLGFPVVAGVSRKGFLRRAVESRGAGRAQTSAEAAEALRDATIAANTAAVLGGAQILRVHDVPAGQHAVAIAEKIISARQ